MDKKVQWHPGFVAAMNLELADSVLKVSIGANKQIIEILKGNEDMYDTLMEIMEPELEERFEKKMEKRLEKVIEEKNEADDVYQTLIKIIEPKLEKEFEKKMEQKFQIKIEKAVEERLKNLQRREQIVAVIENLRDFEHSDDEIKSALRKKYNLSEKEIQEYF